MASQLDATVLLDIWCVVEHQNLSAYWNSLHKQQAREVLLETGKKGNRKVCKLLDGC